MYIHINMYIYSFIYIYYIVYIRIYILKYIMYHLSCHFFTNSMHQSEVSPSVRHLEKAPSRHARRLHRLDAGVQVAHPRAGGAGEGRGRVGSSPAPWLGRMVGWWLEYVGIWVEIVMYSLKFEVFGGWMMLEYALDRCFSPQQKTSVIITVVSQGLLLVLRNCRS